MDSRQLRYFIAVYEQRNLSRAADQANVAQSALSHHISNLEAEFATPLFERKPRGMEPTAAGERLYEHARIILRAMAAAEREIKAGGSVIAGDISIGMANSGVKAIGVPLMRAVLGKYPNLKLSLTESLSGATLLHLMASEVDLALVYNPPSEKDLIAEPVLEEQMFCVGTAEVIGKSKAPITFEELTRLPLIMLRYGCRPAPCWTIRCCSSGWRPTPSCVSIRSAEPPAHCWRDWDARSRPNYSCRTNSRREA
jgi:LysR family nitrogen assimilation transcriptional regulator